MKPYNLLTAFLVLCGALCVNLTVQAREMNAMMEACRGDFQTLCPKVQPGGGRIAECLKQHATELSAPCKERLGDAKQCGEQVKKVCPTGGADKSALRTCMKEHASELAAACKPQ
jgi:hypothetical protein